MKRQRMKCGEKETFSEMLHIAREYIEEQKSIRESEEEFLLRTYKNADQEHPKRLIFLFAGVYE